MQNVWVLKFISDSKYDYTTYEVVLFTTKELAEEYIRCSLMQRDQFELQEQNVRCH